MRCGGEDEDDKCAAGRTRVQWRQRPGLPSVQVRLSEDILCGWAGDTPDGSGMGLDLW